MIQDRIAALETTLGGAANLSPDTRAQLLGLLAELKTELATLTAVPETHAQEITASMDAAFSRATKSTESGDTDALSKLRESFAGFEATHPQLVSVVDRIALALSNMGI